MCMAKVYVDTGGDDHTLLLEDVSTVETMGNRVRVGTLFGDTRELEAVIRSVDFQNSSIVLETVD